jgi:signal transduction protein with GAF and PtsI domain
LSEAASKVAPAAGLAQAAQPSSLKLSECELNALDTLARQLESARPDASRVVETFVAALAEVVPFDTCSVTLAADGEYRVAHAAGEHAELLRGRRVVQNDGVTGWTLANQQPFCNANPQLDFSPDIAARFARYRTLAAFPITRGEESLGALTVYSATLKEYNAEHQRLLAAAVMVLATALSPATRADAEIKINHPSLHNGDAPTAVLGGDKLHAPIESELTH